MDVRCDKCQARYRIDDARVGPQGLAMRCGKCGNTFRASRETAHPAVASPAPAAAPAATAPAPARAVVPVAAAKPAVASAPAKPPAAPAAPPRTAPKPSEGGATVMFSAPPAAPAAAAVNPAAAASAPRPAPPQVPPAAPLPARAAPPPPQKAATPKAAAAATAGALVAPPGDEAAGRTMMFNAAASLRTQPRSRTPAGTVKPLSKPTDAAGATLVFGAGQAVTPRPKGESGTGASATILFGTPPPPLGRAPAAQLPTPPPPTPAVPLGTGDVALPADEGLAGMAAGQLPEAAGEPIEGAAAADSGAVAAEGSETGAAPEETKAAEPREPPEQALVWRGPPRALVIAVAAALALVLVLAGVALAFKKLGHRAPPQAALDALADASAAADKDTLASLAEADAQTNAALQLAPKAHFPEAWAQLAEVQIAWSDALNDQAWYWSEQASRALASGDDKKKAESEAKAAALQDAAKARLKTAFEAAATGNKMDPKSPDVALALADYYRAARSRLNLSRELKRAALLKADDARIAFVQGAELLAEDEGGSRALEKLKAALAGSPRSARIRFRIAMAYISMHQDAEAKKELLATLDLSPQHERARMAMELLAPPGAQPATPEGKRE